MKRKERTRTTGARRSRRSNGQTPRHGAAVAGVATDPCALVDPTVSEKFELLLKRWAVQPVAFVIEALGAAPDPWQCDVLDALMAHDNVAVRACHGVGKTALVSWVVLWFLITRPFSKIPITAPTFNKQVRDVLWAEIHKWWRIATQRNPWLASLFQIRGTRLAHVKYPNEWFAVGIASNEATHIEGYHAQHLLAVFDEAKGIPRATWEATHGMRTTQEAKLLVTSTPGGPGGEFYKLFTKYRETWKALFVIHPRALEEELRRPETAPFSKTGGTYYSDRVRPQWVAERALEWGKDSPVFIARVVGDFPVVENDALIPYTWLSDAEDRENGAAGPRWVACDVARYGKDRTVFLVGEGGTVLCGETMARTPSESTAPERHTVGVGDDPGRPRYRAIDITADICQRLRREWKADGIVVDDTGLGGGVADLLRRRGERVVPLHFGAAPTDKPRTAEEHEARARRHLVESNFVNLKAQMAWALRGAFETGSIALGRLLKALLDPLIAQASMVKQELDPSGRIRIVDPDEQGEDLLGAAAMEGRRSPDHFHALQLLWWMAGGAGRTQAPRAGAVLPGITRVGRPSNGLPGLFGTGGWVGTPRQPTSGGLGGQARYIVDGYGPYG